MLIPKCAKQAGLKGLSPRKFSGIYVPRGYADSVSPRVTRSKSISKYGVFNYKRRDIRN